MPANNSQFLTDIQLDLAQHELRPVYSTNTQRSRGPGGEGWVIDLPTISGRDNLVQAIIIRLLTPQGELADLGHPLYGSRLHEMVGQVNTETTRNLMRLRILESLLAEPRIEKIEQVEVVPNLTNKSSVDVSMNVLPVGETSTLSIGPITLELGE